MPDYDTTLKQLFRSNASVALKALTGTTIVRWLDVELPRVQNPRIDLLGETHDGELVHLELQSANDPEMGLRMCEYCFAIYRKLGAFPRQVLVYVGQGPLTMPACLRGPRQLVEWDVVDMRELDAEPLIRSGEVSDNVIGILARLWNERDAVHRVVQRFSELPQGKRDEALEQLIVLSGLRRLDPIVREEAHRMPVYIDLSENVILGPAFNKGRLEGETAMVRRQLQKRFGELPPWAEERLAQMTAPQIEQLGERLLDAGTLEEAFA